MGKNKTREEKKNVQDKLTSMEELNATMISHARQIARKIGASAVLVYVDVIKSREQLSTLLKERRCILAARYQEVIDDLAEMEGVEDRIIRVPYINLTRQSQVKVAAMLALSQGLIKKGDRIVCLSGPPKYEIFYNRLSAGE